MGDDADGVERKRPKRLWLRSDFIRIPDPRRVFFLRADWHGPFSSCRLVSIEDRFSCRVSPSKFMAKEQGGEGDRRADSEKEQEQSYQDPFGRSVVLSKGVFSFSFQCEGVGFLFGHGFSETKGLFDENAAS